MIGGPSTLAPLLIFLFYVISLVILIKGDYVFWIFNNILVINNPKMYPTTRSSINSFLSTKAFVSLVLIIIYCFGVLGVVDSKHYNEDVPLFNDSISGFMYAMPVTSWFFIGIEALPFVTDMVINHSLTCLLILMNIILQG